VHHCWFPPSRPRRDILEQDAGEDGHAPFQEFHQQTIHFTVRLFLAKGRVEVTRRTCLLTAGSTHLNGADQIAWVLEKTKKNEGKKQNGDGNKDGKKPKSNKRKDEKNTLTVIEDETTEWENNIVFEWTKKAQKLVEKDVDNIFEKGIIKNNMTIDKLVRGYNSNAPNLTGKKLFLRNQDLTQQEAFRLIVDRAWRCSLEYFLRKNKNQGTCEPARKVLYRPIVGEIAAQEPSNDPLDDAGDTSDAVVSDGLPAESEEVTSYPSQRISSTL